MATAAAELWARAHNGGTDPGSDASRLQELQRRVDALLSGSVRVPEGVVADEQDQRLFAVFLPEDNIRADALAALCEKIVEEEGGVRGLELAVDELYAHIGAVPAGLVEHATKLFLTHSPDARRVLRLRPLNERFYIQM